MKLNKYCALLINGLFITFFAQGQILESWQVTQNTTESPSSLKNDAADFTAIQWPHIITKTDKNAGNAFWYKLTFNAPQINSDECLVLNLKGLTTPYEVWLNDQKIAIESAIKTTNQVNLAGTLQPGENLLYVHLIEPQSLEANTQPRVLTEELWLEIKPTTFLNGLPQIHPVNIDKNAIDFSITTNIVQETPEQTEVVVLHTLFDADEIIKGQRSNKISPAYLVENNSTCIPLKVFEPNKWSPTSPYLYTIKTELIKNEQVVEESRINTGFKTLTIKDSQILINNENYTPKTFDMKWIIEKYGAFTPVEFMIEQLDSAKNKGCNNVLTSGFPDQKLTEWCNRNGVLLWARLPFDFNSVFDFERLKEVATQPSFAGWVIAPKNNFNDTATVPLIWQKRLATFISGIRNMDSKGLICIEQNGEWNPEIKKSVLFMADAILYQNQLETVDQGSVKLASELNKKSALLEWSSDPTIKILNHRKFN